MDDGIRVDYVMVVTLKLRHLELKITCVQISFH